MQTGLRIRRELVTVNLWNKLLCCGNEWNKLLSCGNELLNLGNELSSCGNELCKSWERVSEKNDSWLSVSSLIRYHELHNSFPQLRNSS